jgi:carboxylesterase type B
VQQPVYDNIVTAVGCSNATSSLSCLRKVSWESLNSALNSSITASVVSIRIRPQCSCSNAIKNLFPVLDGDFLREPASISLPAGRFIKVPLLTGTNTDEGTAFGPRGINTTAEFLAYISSISTENCTVATIAALYPDIPNIGIPSTYKGRTPATALLGSQYKRSSAIAGDSLFIAPRRYTSEIWARWNLTSYSYRFNVLPNGIPSYVGVTHFQEVAFAFANIEGLGYPITPFGTGSTGLAQKKVATLMSRMWVSFIATGNPNRSGGK